MTEEKTDNTTIEMDNTNKPPELNRDDSAGKSWAGSDDISQLTTWSKITGASLTWEDVTVTVKTQNGDKDILRNLNGVAPRGQIVAILGPSGAGKTTLLKTLSGQQPYSKGTIYYEGKPKSKIPSIGDIMGFDGNASFLAQEPVMMGSLTVTETLYYAAALKTTDTKVDLDERVNHIIDYLGLQSCRDTKLGNVFFKGVSGGEKRRVSIGVELVTQPALIFFDEPTSNLDATSAYALMNIAHKLTSLNHTCIMTLHQPSSRIFNNLCEWGDYLLILEAGRTVYNGLCREAVQFFTECGFPVPNQTNPPDHFLDVINSSFQESNENAEKCANHYKDKYLPKIINTREQCHKTAKDENRIVKEEHNFVILFWILLLRNFKNDLRDPGKYIVRVALYLMMCITLGTFYWKIGDKNSDVQDRTSVIFFVTIFLTFMSIAALPAFLIERSVYIRERMNHHYGPLPYTLANFVSSLPWLFVISVICSAIVMGMVNSRQGGGYYSIYMTNLFMSLVCVEAMMLAISAVTPEFILGLGAASSFLGLYALLSGFFILPANIPDGWKWAYHAVSFYKYTFQTFMYNEFHNFNGKGSDGLDGNAVLQSYSMRDTDVGFNFGIVIIMTFVYRLTFYAFLKIFNRKLA